MEALQTFRANLWTTQRSFRTIQGSSSGKIYETSSFVLCPLSSVFSSDFFEFFRYVLRTVLRSFQTSSWQFEDISRTSGKVWSSLEFFKLPILKQFSKLLRKVKDDSNMTSTRYSTSIFPLLCVTFYLTPIIYTKYFTAHAFSRFLNCPYLNKVHWTFLDGFHNFSGKLSKFSRKFLQPFPISFSNFSGQHPDLFKKQLQTFQRMSSNCSGNFSVLFTKVF